MSSLKDVAATKLAVELCNNPQLKKEILCVSGSDYDVNKPSENRNRKRLWDELLEEKTWIISRNLGLAKQQLEKVIGIILSLGMRILCWAEYHERILGLSRNYSFNAVKSSFFTTRGIVDCRKAAKELINDKSLSVKQKYKLALLYCLEEHIPALCEQLTEEDKDKFYDSENPSRIKQSHCVKFFSYYLRGEVDKIRGDTDPHLYWLAMAAKSGNKDAIEYCLEQTNLVRNEDALIQVSLEAVGKNMRNEREWIVFDDDWRDSEWKDGDCKDDDYSNYYRELFDGRFYNWEGPWVPNHYYNDAIYFLFTKMRQDAQIAFLRKDVEGQSIYAGDPFASSGRSRVLEFFLDWPYQDYFLKTARLMWDFLNEKSLFYLLKCFALKIGANKGEYEYGEKKNYDYRELLIKFLNEIPEHSRRFVFKDFGNKYQYFWWGMKNAGTVLICNLLKMENYTYRDKTIIELILKNATGEEKEKIILSGQGTDTCTELIRLRRWKLLDQFISNCTSKEKVLKVKKELSFSKSVMNVCVDFLADFKWHAFESFFKWSSLTNVEIKELKEKIIFSEIGRITCMKMISSDQKLTAFNKVIELCFPTEKEVTAFRKKLLLCHEGMQKCVELILLDQFNLVNEFIKCSLSSPDEEVQYKKNVANERGRDICARLIYNAFYRYDTLKLPFDPVLPFYPLIHGCKINPIFEFNDGKWDIVEKFLSWCFSSEDEINDFKKSLTVRSANGIRNHLAHIHLILIYGNKWKDAEKLFSWLGFSLNEIRELKKETILSRECMACINGSVQDPGVGNILDCAGGEWEEMEQYLRWFLENEDDVLQFRNRFDEVFGIKSYEDHGEDIPYEKRNNFNKFYLFLQKFPFQ